MFKNVFRIAHTKIFVKGNGKNIYNNIIIPATKYSSIKLKPKVRPKESLKWILLIFPVGSFGLGCWQIHRLQWKLDLISRLQFKTQSSPVDLPNNFVELQDMEFCPVNVRGEFVHEKEFLIGPRSLIENDGHYGGSLLSDPKKNQGWLVITPFKLANNGQEILVNRGWIPSHLRPKEKRSASMVEGEVELTGLVRLTEKRGQFMPKNNPLKGVWFYRDLDEMSSYFDCLPVWLDARGINDPPSGWPVPNQTRVTLRNEHMGYIITWFMLSAFTGYLWHRNFIKKLHLL